MDASVKDQKDGGVTTTAERTKSGLKERISTVESKGQNGKTQQQQQQHQRDDVSPPGERHENLYVALRELPAFSDLNRQVQAIVKQSTWWEIRGVDWAMLLSALAVTFLCLPLMRVNNWWALLAGGVFSGIAHASLTVKGGHLATHGVLSASRFWNKIWTRFFIEFLGSYSSHMTNEYHIKLHHPHTNIIGLGDSSSWKVPSLSRFPYMFVAPIALPIVTPFVAISQMWGLWKHLFLYACVVLSGYVSNVLLLVYVSGFSVAGAFAFIVLNRAVMMIPYIHVNIFQHIGLSMYSKDDRPTRLYQMATGVLNLNRNPLLGYCFGLGIINCHVEHHLFPKLSDNMCLKVKPVVSAFFKQHNLPYQERNYSERLHLFVEKYEELMVNAPTILHFVGIQ